MMNKKDNFGRTLFNFDNNEDKLRNLLFNLDEDEFCDFILNFFDGDELIYLIFDEIVSNNEVEKAIYYIKQMCF